jgi:pyranose oxidase
MSFCQVKLWKELVESVRVRQTPRFPTVEAEENVNFGLTKPNNIKAASWGSFWETETAPTYYIDRLKAEHKKTHKKDMGTDDINKIDGRWIKFCDVLKAKVQQHEDDRNRKDDPLPFPANDPDPQCYYAFSDSQKWHTQIHRDAFGYGQVPTDIDQRRVVDLRWFGYTEGENSVTFSTKVKDEFGMPQVSATITLRLEFPHHWYR